MNKYEFLTRLREGLAGLPPIEIAEREFFYSEMIDDRVEDGLSEEEAVRALGTLEDVVAAEKASLLAQSKPRKRRKGWTVTWLVLGSPVWVSVLLAVAAVAVSLYVSLWAVVLSLWAVFVSLLAAAVGAVGCGVVWLFTKHLVTAIALIGVGLACAGLGILLFFGCQALTKACARLTVVLAKAIKRMTAKKEEAR